MWNQTQTPADYLPQPTTTGHPATAGQIGALLADIAAGRTAALDHAEILARHPRLAAALSPHIAAADPFVAYLPSPPPPAHYPAQAPAPMPIPAGAQVQTLILPNGQQVTGYAVPAAGLEPSRVTYRPTGDPLVMRSAAGGVLLAGGGVAAWGVGSLVAAVGEAVAMIGQAVTGAGVVVLVAALVVGATRAGGAALGGAGQLPALAPAPAPQNVFNGKVRMKVKKMINNQ
ncbi:hypothetical protein [Kitasatospora kifunensis]|uniref:Uncharacterized protein n=1 Tax=Kitasatospora kifunensis TaxID=58351 RepID=A0A7W7W0H2_KITKI|nr:hypothetical protein [Kitasatospora kifunensis]MBB4929173.1 hypothetical protein [Kitasatospora kifunensis]